jgi:phospholipase/carboxylesterase
MSLLYREINSLTKPKKLVILLHGYGSNCNDLITLAPEFQDILPDATFISPNAPFNHEGGTWGAYQWYSLMDRSDEAMHQGAVRASKILVPFIEEHLQRLNLGFDNLILTGFSQGGMMTIFNSLRFQEQILAGISFSGYVAGINNLKSEIKSHPPLLLTHGSEDEVVPYSALARSLTVLKEHGVNAEGYSAHGLSHGIDIGCINAAKKFLKVVISN